MRWLLGAISMSALAVVGCSDSSDDGLSGGNVLGDVCRPATGEPGSGGGGYYPPEPPGVYSGEVDAFVRFETSSDCTALVPSTECTIDSDNTEPAFFEIEFEGLDEQGEKCGAAIAVTTEMVSEVPILGPGTLSVRFSIDAVDDSGATWRIDARWPAPYGVEGSVRRTQGDTYCEGFWFADEGCAF